MGAPRSLALCHYYLGAADYLCGRFQAALAQLTEAVALYHQVDAPAGEAVALQFLGMTHTALGDLDAGRRHLEHGIAVAQRGLMPSHTLIRLYAALGRNRLDANDAAGARAAAEAGLALIDRHAGCICNASIHTVAAVALALTGDLDRAAALGREALARADALGSPFFRCLAFQADAMIHALTGAWEPAFAALDQARLHAEAGGFPYELGRVLLLRAFVHTRRGGLRDLPAATALLAEAAPLFLRLGARAGAAQARSSLRFLRDQAARPRIAPLPDITR
jgi:tetratricopeptide (TPR) repeat protein